MRFAEMEFDNVFGDLIFEDDVCTSTIEDPAGGHKVILTMDHNFNACVVYTPPHREAICIEPYTCVPDPFRLAAQGIDAGLLVIKPNQSIQMAVDIRVA